jgi:hypothetical protein
LADPEVAAATMRRHLDRLWESGEPDRLGWKRTEVDELHHLVELPAIETDGSISPYYVRVGAEFYDAFPPTTSFVVPEDLSLAKKDTRWLPLVDGSPWFGLHTPYQGNGIHLEQLVCFSFTAEYYMVDHAPPETAVWKQGRHTVAATLHRLAEVLSPPVYKGPQGVDPAEQSAEAA